MWALFSCYFPDPNINLIIITFGKVCFCLLKILPFLDLYIFIKMEKLHQTVRYLDKCLFPLPYSANGKGCLNPSAAIHQLVRIITEKFSHGCLISFPINWSVSCSYISVPHQRAWRQVLLHCCDMENHLWFVPVIEFQVKRMMENI